MVVLGSLVAVISLLLLDGVSGTPSGKGATSIDEPSLGTLMMNFMLETIVAKHMMGVDPFDQPADDEGKDRARR